MSTPILTLQDSLTRLTVAPEIGASLVNWVRLSDGLPLLRPSDDEALASANPRKLACYPLAPWSNRIGGGGFDCPDGWLALQANTSHEALPIHGSAWQQPWQVIHQSEQAATLELHSQVPFPYRARFEIALHEGQLSLDLYVTHHGEHPIWYGLGLHPYLPRTPATRLQASARSVWLCDDDKLSHEHITIPADWNFNEQRALPQELVDNAFTNWNGQAYIVQPDHGYQLQCNTTDTNVYLLFCPTEQNFFCFEPVSHPVNAHHLPGRPGLVLLHRDQTTHLRYSLHYRPLPAS